MSKKVHKLRKAPARNPNPKTASRARALEEECEKLRQSLAQVAAERDLYLKALYAYGRSTLHFENVDIPELERMTSGPVLRLE